MSAFVLTDAAIERALAPGLDVGHRWTSPATSPRRLQRSLAARDR
jgi:hypothetical protein